MAENSKSPMAGGFILAVGTIGGTAIGVSLGQPTIGFLVGLGIATVIAIAIWLVDRAR